MAINKLSLENFTVFKNIDISFSDGINIFIGENGSGKTHLLKLLYLFTLDLYEDFGQHVFEEIFTEELLGIIRDKDKNSKTTQCCTINGRKEKLSSDIWQISGNSIQEIGGKVGKNLSKPDSIFIPAKEMLSHSKGLLALERERKIPFDKTLVDIIAKAQLGETRGLTELQKALLPKISKVIGGEVIYDEKGTFYIKKDSGLKIEFSMEAEGLRKFGLLWRLIRNGLFTKNTVLFWDEPEANINPANLPSIVDTILELHRNGVQIFIATHDYILAKYFEIKREKEDRVMFYSLFESGHGIQCEKNEFFKNLKENPIVKAFDILLDEVYDKNLGD